MKRIVSWRESRTIPFSLKPLHVGFTKLYHQHGKVVFSVHDAPYASSMTPVQSTLCDNKNSLKHAFEVYKTVYMYSIRRLEVDVDVFIIYYKDSLVG